ncbi:ensconsin-like isoform X12 [Centruroides vittatus]|uniref:ensconsin-like isoform X12 n=1 Tax=Centruroides vittatus TaxID=120091 RepID=UPI0035105DC9
MSHNSRPSSVNRVATNKECLEEKNDPEGDSNYTTVTYQADGKESITLSQKEKEDRIRQFREQQEEERQRRLYELQNATIQAQKHREQLEDERRKKIKELRIKEIERRQAVEERKRMIWEAEQERKEAILKRNLEREARIEARRNAQRNAMSYAFGSSTPRSFDLDLVALGSSRLASQGSIVLSASSSHQIDEKEHDSKKFLKSNCLDRKPASTKDVPSRPRSSMSATSEQSVASSQASVTSVKMRTGPKRQRPVSIGGVPSVLLPNVDQQQNRKGRSIERKAITPNAKHIRAKSCEKTDENKSQTPVIRKPAASQKVSKVKQVAADTNVAQNNQTVQPEAEDLQKSENNKENTPETASSPLSHMKSRITSEEEAKAAIAEKRRIAREQAEREAELERQRLEKIRQEEEELRRKEEEEQKRFEEEQIKLAEIHRLQEEEKLRKAIEEQEQREKEERERQEEEMRLRIEKEEMERKAREEAEKQRLELEERLKKEEAERAERKRRVEQIMSRTRKIGAPSEAKETSQTNKLSSPEEEEEKPLPASSQETTVGDNLEVKSSDNSSAQSSIQSDIIDAFVPSNASLNGGIQEEFKNSNPFVEQSFSQGNYLFNGEKTIDNNEKENHLNTSEFSMKESDSGVILTDNSPNRTTKLDAVSQPNGYNHQDEDKSFTDSISPEEKSEVSVDVLLDFGTIPSSSELQSTAPNSIPTTEFDQLIDISIDTSTRAKQILYINQMK